MESYTALSPNTLVCNLQAYNCSDLMQVEAATYLNTGKNLQVQTVVSWKWPEGTADRITCEQAQMNP